MTHAPAGANRLALQTSPYLLQHANNPVDWYPWGAEALERAAREDRPILLSIGYAACHWCHVMERECFENDVIAAQMNAHFVCIKVDREERPDLDDLYMAATIALTGGGGWPMTVFLTPEQTPFFAGTYFPPQDRQGQLGFPNLLARIAQLWSRDRDQLFRQAGELHEHIRAQSELDPPKSIAADSIERAVSHLQRSFDATWGGFGSAPKFPPSQALHLLLRHYDRVRDPAVLTMLTRTLDAMKDGGIYDQIGGGFARYSTDERWFAPHFEKMLYDNAQLARVYLEAFQLTQQREYERVVRETLDYTLREMQAPEGGYYSATDADSEGEEGKYFTFTAKQLRQILEPEETRAFCGYYGVTESGNWEGTNILHVSEAAAEVGPRLKLDESELQALLQSARHKVLQARAQRVAPNLDDKVLVSWNALMIGTMAEAGRVLGDARYLQSAQRAARFIFEHLHSEAGQLLRTARAGVAHLDAYLEDHALLADALVDLYEADGNSHWLRQARRLTERLLSDFYDPSTGTFFQTSSQHEELIVRMRDGNDGALPNANAIAARALLRLAWHLDEPKLGDAAQAVLRAYGQRIERLPRAHLSFLNVLSASLEGPVELVLGGDFAATQALRSEVAGHFLPQRVIIHGSDPGAPSLTQGKGPLAERAALYICRHHVCERPLTSPADVAARLKTALAALNTERSSALRGAKLDGLATAAETERYLLARDLDPSAMHILPGSGLAVSRIGFGAYRVHEEFADHRRALLLALRTGCNLVDTAASYTQGGSERAIGDALSELTRTGEITRRQIVIMSKLGLLQAADDALKSVPGASALGQNLGYSLHPEFLEQQLTQSLQRLNLQALDICLLHNPELLLEVLPRQQVLEQLTEAFVWLEAQRKDGRIGCYGVSCGKLEIAAEPSAAALSVDELRAVVSARDLPGFSVLQLPLNPLEPDAHSNGVLARAEEYAWAVFTHRALNAMPKGQLWRLANAPVEPDAADFATAQAELAALEAEFKSRLGAVLGHATQSDFAPDTLLTWAGRINAEHMQNRALWNEFERGVLAPQLARVLGALDQAFAGKQLGQVWREFRKRYVPAFEALLRAARATSAANSNAQNAPLQNAFAHSKAFEEQPHASLAQQVIWGLGSLPAVSSVLVGMREPSYVRDLVETLRWPAMPEPAAVFFEPKR